MGILRFLGSLVVALLICATLVASWVYLEVAYPIKYEPEIRAAITQTWGADRVDELEPFILAVVRSESNFNPESRSAADARGLMQLLPTTATEIVRKNGLTDYTEAKLTDPATNLRLGTLYLKGLLEAFHNDTDLVLAGYNGGPGLAAHLESGQTIATETSLYIAAVKRRQSEYSRRLQIYHRWHL